MPITKVDVKPAHEQEQLDAISWRELVNKKKQQLAGAIPAKWKLDVSLVKELTEANGGRLLELDPARRSGVLDDVELDITESYSAVELVEKIAFGRLTAAQVVTAFCKRAAVAQQLTSCLTESFYDEAIARAKYLDEFYRENGKTIGPLHGLPISLKDTFKVVGFDATAGYINGLKLGPATTNSCLVSVLLDAGAVLYVKTNVPQTLMTADSENHIYGRTLNPHNLNLNAGGSSGGEGALVAFRGSPIGVGTDIAGSIRIPAMCCGNYGLKPTNHRVPYGNQSEGEILSLPGPFPSAGPIASTMEGLQLFMNAINALSAAGHEVVRLPYDYERSIDLGLRLSYQFFELAHPPEEDLAAVPGEPLVKAAAARMHPFTAKPRPVPKDLAKPWHHLDDLDAARAKFAETWHRTWFDYKLDAIVAPGADKTAVPHDTYGLMPYTVVFNLLDYPSCLVPTGPASKTLDPELVKAQDPFLPDYDPSAVDGAPCDIQVVTLKLKDEECLAAAAVVDKIVNADRQK
ncbi:Acetamidase [Colletotrichum tropicale]|nr:Acetamidase [Colletotrichum tropicale]